MSEDRTAKFFYGYVVVAAALLIMVISTGALYSFGVFFKPVLTEFGLHPENSQSLNFLPSRSPIFCLTSLMVSLEIARAR